MQCRSEYNDINENIKSTSYKFVTNSAEHFTTSTAAVWINVFTTEMYNQRLNYLHWNQVIAGHVTKPGIGCIILPMIILLLAKRLLNLVILDGF